MYLYCIVITLMPLIIKIVKLTLCFFTILALLRSSLRPHFAVDACALTCITTSRYEDVYKVSRSSVCGDKFDILSFYFLSLALSHLVN